MLLNISIYPVNISLNKLILNHSDKIFQICLFNSRRNRGIRFRRISLEMESFRTSACAWTEKTKRVVFYRLDFGRSFVSALPPLGRGAGSFPKQRLVIEPKSSMESVWMIEETVRRA